jgi:hypothetical protein
MLFTPLFNYTKGHPEKQRRHILRTTAAPTRLAGASAAQKGKHLLKL